MRNLFWLIPLVPLLGVAINGLFGPRLPKRAVGVVACATVAASLLLSAASVWELSGLPPDTLVHPGHGPDTTIGREARINPFWPRA